MHQSKLQQAHIFTTFQIPPGHCHPASQKPKGQERFHHKAQSCSLESLVLSCSEPGFCNLFYHAELPLPVSHQVLMSSPGADESLPWGRWCLGRALKLLLDNFTAKGASPGTPIRGTELLILNNSLFFCNSFTICLFSCLIF